MKNQLISSLAMVAAGLSLAVFSPAGVEGAPSGSGAAAVSETQVPQLVRPDGSLGLIPNWPGPEIYPPQPMLGQIRNVLEKYAKAGGTYDEVVIEGAGHAPFIEKTGEFNAALHQQILTLPCK